MRRCLFPEVADPRASLGLLALRLVAGAAFLFHGWPKIQHPTSWMGAKATMPGILQAAAAVSEFGGGIALILGALVPLAGLGLLCTMAVAAYTHISRGDPFVGRGASWELAILYFSIAILMLLAGPGRYSVDRFLFWRSTSAHGYSPRVK